MAERRLENKSKEIHFLFYFFESLAEDFWSPCFFESQKKRTVATVSLSWHQERLHVRRRPPEKPALAKTCGCQVSFPHMIAMKYRGAGQDSDEVLKSAFAGITAKSRVSG